MTILFIKVLLVKPHTFKISEFRLYPQDCFGPIPSPKKNRMLNRKKVSLKSGDTVRPYLYLRRSERKITEGKVHEFKD